MSNLSDLESTTADHNSQQNLVYRGAASSCRIGVIGCGYWGSKHVRVAMSLSGSSNVVLIDPNEESYRSLIEVFPNLRVFRNLDEARNHVDAVIVATPPQTHGDLALQALRYNKHVLVEKPMATYQGHARRLIEEAKNRGLVLMVGHTFEFNPAVLELRRRVADGQLGQVHYIHSSRLNLGLYRRDVNVVWDLAPHDISIMNLVLDSSPTSVAAWGACHGKSETENLAYIKLDYADVGVTGYIHISWLDPHKVRKVTVVGDKKMAIYDDLSEERLRIFDRGVDINDNRPNAHERPISYRQGDIISPHINFEEPLKIEDSHFLDCIEKGTKPSSSGEAGLGIIAVLEAIDRSIAIKTPIDVFYPGGNEDVFVPGISDTAAE